MDIAPGVPATKASHALLIASLAPFAGILVAACGGVWWPGEMCSHWTLHAVVALLPAAILWRRHRLVGPVAMAAILLGAAPWFLAAWEERAPAPSTAQRQLRVLHANIHYANPRPASALPVLGREPFDLVSLIEVGVDDHAALQHDPRWRHQAWHLPPARRPNRPIMGIALLSAHPITWWTLREVDEEGIIEAEIAIDGRPLRVIVAHPKSPMTPRRLASRQRQFATIAALTAGSPVPVVAMGDFNCSVGSPAWRAFRAVSGLRRAAQPGPATWPAVLGPLGIDIDHILVGHGAALAEVDARWIGGSDHRALVASVGF